MGILVIWLIVLTRSIWIFRFTHILRTLLRLFIIWRRKLMRFLNLIKLWIISLFCQACLISWLQYRVRRNFPFSIFDDLRLQIREPCQQPLSKLIVEFLFVFNQSIVLVFVSDDIVEEMRVVGEVLNRLNFIQVDFHTPLVLFQTKKFTLDCFDILASLVKLVVKDFLDWLYDGLVIKWFLLKVLTVFFKLEIYFIEVLWESQFLPLYFKIDGWDFIDFRLEFLHHVHAFFLDLQGRLLRLVVQILRFFYALREPFLQVLKVFSTSIYLKGVAIHSVLQQFDLSLGV